MYQRNIVFSSFASRWIDEKNFTTLTKPWYAKALPFPFNFYYPRKFKNHANSVMEALFDSLGSQDNIETKVGN